MRWGSDFRVEMPAIVSAVDSTVATLTECIGEKLVGLYLSGSLSLGDFDVNSSDIDLVAVLRETPHTAGLAALRAIHQQLRSEGGWWASRLEVVYLPADACQKISVQSQRHLLLRTDGELELTQPRSDWIVQMYIAREHGPRLAGQEAAEIISTVTEDHLRASVHEAMPFIRRPETKLQNERVLALHVLSACRLLYTKITGRVATKSVAAAWVKEFHHGEWDSVIDAAVAGRGGWDRSVPCDSGYAFVDRIETLLSEGQKASITG